MGQLFLPIHPDNLTISWGGKAVTSVSATNSDPAFGHSSAWSPGIPSVAVVSTSFTPSGRRTRHGHVTRGEPGVVHSSTACPVERSKRMAFPAGTGSGL